MYHKGKWSKRHKYPLCILYIILYRDYLCLFGQNEFKRSGVMVDSTKLELNKEYKYTELCTLFGEKTKRNDSKTAQLKQWASWFSWEHPINPKTKKPSKKFKVTQIYETQQSIKDKRSDRRTIDLELAILLRIYTDKHIVVNEKYENITNIGRDDFHCAIGLSNEYYKKVRHYTTDLQIENFTIQDFYNCTDSQFKGYVKTNLESLRKKRVLRWLDGRIWVEILRDTDGKEICRRYHPCDEMDMARLDTVYERALRWWNDNHDVKVAHPGKIKYCLNGHQKKQYYEKVAEIANDYGFPGFEFSYVCYRIVYSKEAVERELLTYGYDREELGNMLSYLKHEREMVNETSLKAVKTNIINRSQKADNQHSKIVGISRVGGNEQTTNSVSSSSRKRNGTKSYTRDSLNLADATVDLKASPETNKIVQVVQSIEQIIRNN